MRGGEAEEAAHAAYLVLLAFGDGNPKFSLAQDFHGARLGDVTADVYALLHLSFEIRRQRLCRHDFVFLLVCALGIEERIGDAAIVCQDDEPVGILVEPAEREYTFDWKNLFDFLFTFLCRVCDDAAGFVVGKVAPLGLAPFQVYFVTLVDLVAQNSRLPVDSNETLFDEFIGFASCAVLLQREVFVDAHGVCGLFRIHR